MFCLPVRVVEARPEGCLYLSLLVAHVHDVLNHKQFHGDVLINEREKLIDTNRI